ncbi:LPXTG cell wall anchor domain-containing protein, partial [Bifidobacterium dentium]
TGSNVIGIAVVGMIVLLTGAAIMLTRRNRD